MANKTIEVGNNCTNCEDASTSFYHPDCQECMSGRGCEFPKWKPKRKEKAVETTVLPANRPV